MPLWFFLWFPPTILPMKKPCLFFGVVCLLSTLASCGGNSSTFQPVLLDLGTMIGTQKEDEVDPSSQLKKISYPELATLIAEKGNFLFLLKGSDDFCECWHTLHDDCLVPYVKAKHLLIYTMDLSAFEKETERYGIPRYANHDTLALFQDGKLAASINNAEDEAWGKDPKVFNDWMVRHVSTPKVFTVNQAQLDGLYEGTAPNGEKVSRPALYYFRASCPDCSYLSRVDLKDYFSKRDTASQPLYAFDADAWKVDPESYQAKKDAYGLSQTEENPLGYGTGAFPTILSIIPNAGEKISSIDQMGVFYNEKIENDVIASSYFTAERGSHPEAGFHGALSYASNVSPNILEGRTAPAGSSIHERLSSLTHPLVSALLDEIL